MQQMPDMTALLKIAQSPAGQTLLSVLKNTDPARLDRAAAAVSAGDPEAAKEELRQLLSSGEAQALLRQLEHLL